MFFTVTIAITITVVITIPVNILHTKPNLITLREQSFSIHLFPKLHFFHITNGLYIFFSLYFTIEIILPFILKLIFYLVFQFIPIIPIFFYITSLLYTLFFNLHLVIQLIINPSFLLNIFFNLHLIFQLIFLNPSFLLRIFFNLHLVFQLIIFHILTIQHYNCTIHNSLYSILRCFTWQSHARHAGRISTSGLPKPRQLNLKCWVTYLSGRRKPLGMFHYLLPLHLHYLFY